jgi:hypothetical protein
VEKPSDDINSSLFFEMNKKGLRQSIFCRLPATVKVTVKKISLSLTWERCEPLPYYAIGPCYFSMLSTQVLAHPAEMDRAFLECRATMELQA